MRIYSKQNFNQAQQNEISKAVSKKIGPGVFVKSNIKVSIPGYEITGQYLKGRLETFTVTNVVEKDGAIPKPKKTKKLSQKKPSEAEKRKKLISLKKDELIKLCKKHKIKHESDNNKATLVDLLMLNGKGE